MEPEDVANLNLVEYYNTLLFDVTRLTTKVVVINDTPYGAPIYGYFQSDFRSEESHMANALLMWCLHVKNMPYNRVFRASKSFMKQSVLNESTGLYEISFKTWACLSYVTAYENKFSVPALNNVKAAGFESVDEFLSLAQSLNPSFNFTPRRKKEIRGIFQ